MKRKRCKDCGAAKPSSGFYGVQTECKECTKTRVRAFRLLNIERLRAYDRNRPNADERRIDNLRRYRERTSTPAGRAREWERKKKYLNSDKKACNTIVGNAIRGGKLVKEPCERCNSEDSVHAHHEDYTKPMEVIWLCPPCHGLRHTSAS